MKVELLHSPGCASTVAARALVTEVLEALAPGTRLEELLVDTPERARELDFRGSPSVRVGGIDLEELPAAPSGST